MAVLRLGKKPDFHGVDNNEHALGFYVKFYEKMVTTIVN